VPNYEAVAGRPLFFAEICASRFHFDRRNKPGIFSSARTNFLPASRIFGLDIEILPAVFK
jgi:hypothetical protein